MAAASSPDELSSQVQHVINEQVATVAAAASDASAATPTPVVIGPGRARFTFLPTGAWLGFGPSGGAARRTSGREVLIPGGGFVVFATDAHANVQQLIDTRTNDARTVGHTRVMRSHEGADGGMRYPSARPDDDSDGLIDEDFAAIGDAMAVTTYAPANDPAANAGPSPSSIEIHQESYAWTVPHIDGMVVTRVTVTNTGSGPVEGLRIGAVFDKRDDFNVDTQDFGEDDTAPFADALVAKGMLLRGGHQSVAALFFSTKATGFDDAMLGGTSWLTGVAPVNHRLIDLVEASRRADAIRRPGEPDPIDAIPDETAEGTVGGPDAFSGPAAPITPGQRVSHVAYGISPELGTLEPGDRFHIYVALVIPPTADRAARAINDAYRTVIGDGTHRLIPPPVSVTRRVVWGTYELRSPDNAAAGVMVTLADPRSDGVNPLEINYIRGIDLRSTTRWDMPDGNARLEFSNGNMDRFTGNTKVVLQGRMSDGEWFDAILQPVAGAGDGHLLPAEQFFNQPGKLDEALLSGSPNPFRDATTIHYEVPTNLTDEHGVQYVFAGSIATSVKVYNVTGRLVSTLIETTSPPGRYETQWNAQDGAGSSVASGVYYIKLQIGKRYVTRRLIQLK